MTAFDSDGYLYKKSVTKNILWIGFDYMNEIEFAIIKEFFVQPTFLRRLVDSKFTWLLKIDVL